MQNQGYNVTTPPCTRQELAPEKYIQPIEAAAIHFDRILKIINHPKHEDCTKLLLDIFQENNIIFEHINSYEKFCELANYLQKEDFNIKTPPCTSLEFACVIDSLYCSYPIHQFILPKDIQPLELAAARFDNWMKLPDNIQRRPLEALFLSLEDQTTKLFRHIKSYEELCQLTLQLQTKGYKIPNPPCTFSEFAEIAIKADPISFGGRRPILSENQDQLIELAATRFEDWMLQNNHPKSDRTDNIYLLCFLNDAEGFCFIRTYKALCQLASFLFNKGYKISEPPCTPEEYNQLLKDAEPKNSAGIEPCNIFTLHSLCLDTLIKHKNQEGLKKYLENTFEDNTEEGVNKFIRLHPRR